MQATVTLFITRQSVLSISTLVVAAFLLLPIAVLHLGPWSPDHAVVNNCMHFAIALVTHTSKPRRTSFDRFASTRRFQPYPVPFSVLRCCFVGVWRRLLLLLLLLCLLLLCHE